MKNPRGFLEIKHKKAPYRDIAQRINDFKEVEIRLSEKEIQEQASRCMDCGIPFCHGCGCPLGNLIPEFNDYVSRGFWREALLVLLSVNDFPEFTGRVCPAICEAACTAGLHGENVSIRQIEIALVEKGFKEGFIVPCPPPSRTGKTVAIIGSGPAGLSAANQLNKAGHTVTVFEKDKYCGGILRYGIPDFKLEKSVLERRINLMKQEGIIFETEINAGEDINAGFLMKRFDAVCLAIGAGEPRDIKVPGRDLKNIHFAMDFLTQQNRILSKEQIFGDLISAKGKKVLVIGGGDTGSDCVGTSNRQSAASVTQIEIMPKPPMARSEGTPWPQWPYMLRTSSSHYEGCDRQWDVMTKSFEGSGGIVKSVNAVKVQWQFSPSGFPVSMNEIPGSEFIIPADLVLLSMGFTGVKKIELLNQFGITLDKKGNILAENTLCTGLKNIFVAGDSNSGASLVVRAIQSGKTAAEAINKYLSC